MQNEEEKLIRILIRTLLVFVVLFMILKSIRHKVLSNTESSILKVFLNSFPNLAEGVCGVLILTSISIYGTRILLKLEKPKVIWLGFISFFIAVIYVITQELKIHNLGGKNIYDPIDVMFSILGLLIGLSIVLYFNRYRAKDPGKS